MPRDGRVCAGAETMDGRRGEDEVGRPVEAAPGACADLRAEAEGEDDQGRELRGDDAEAVVQTGR